MKTIKAILLPEEEWPADTFVVCVIEEDNKALYVEDAYFLILDIEWLDTGWKEGTLLEILTDGSDITSCNPVLEEDGSHKVVNLSSSDSWVEMVKDSFEEEEEELD